MGMGYLIDTHVPLWWLFDDPRICQNSHYSYFIVTKNPSCELLFESLWNLHERYATITSQRAKNEAGGVRMNVF